MKSLLDGYHKLLKILMTLLMALMLVPVTLQMLARHTDMNHYIWTEEVARFCFVWIVMTGAIVAVRDETHFDVDVIPRPKSAKEAAISRLVVHAMMLVMSVVFAWYGFAFARFGAIQQSEMSGINMLLIYVSFPLAGFSWVVFLVEKLANDVRQLKSVDSKS